MCWHMSVIIDCFSGTLTMNMAETLCICVCVGTSVITDCFNGTLTMNIAETVHLCVCWHVCHHRLF